MRRGIASFARAFESERELSLDHAGTCIHTYIHTSRKYLEIKELAEETARLQRAFESERKLSSDLF
jgi:hypothetical protein